MSSRHVQVLIVGGGPSGLTAAIYTGRAGLKPLVAAGSVLGNILPGGQLMLTTEVENLPGFPGGIQGPDLMELYRKQAEKFGAEVIEEWATEFQFSTTPGTPHTCKVGDMTVTADAVILANGAAAKWLGLPEEDIYVNHGISACATCDGPLPIFRNKPIYVVGGGDSAAEEALFLAKFASKVTVLVRRDKLRASKIMAQRLMDHPKIEVLFNTHIDKYVGDGENLTGLMIKDSESGQVRQVECQGLFMAIGHEPNTKFLKGSGVDMDEQGYIKVDRQVYTNLEGVFACGDVHDTMFRQAVTASGFGCMAAIAAERWLEARGD